VEATPPPSLDASLPPTQPPAAHRQQSHSTYIFQATIPLQALLHLLADPLVEGPRYSAAPRPWPRLRDRHNSVLSLTQESQIPVFEPTVFDSPRNVKAYLNTADSLANILTNNNNDNTINANDILNIIQIQ
jgi:hypothetical protein